MTPPEELRLGESAGVDRELLEGISPGATSEKNVPSRRDVCPRVVRILVRVLPYL